MKHPNQEIFTVDEFKDWAERQTSGRFELDRGRIVEMAPERIRHARVKTDIYGALGLGIINAQLGCEALPDGVSLRIDDDTLYEPDAMVRCGMKADGDATEISDPVIVVEVLSASSRGVDVGAKFARYFSLPSVRHYLIVDADRRTVIHHWRDDAGEIRSSILASGTVKLDPPGLEMNIDAALANA
jgi:Uma2 family endonuclease